MLSRKEWDRNRKPIYIFKAKNFGYNSKKCSKCGKRKNRFHHYLCEYCWQIKQKNRSNQMIYKGE